MGHGECGGIGSCPVFVRRGVGRFGEIIEINRQEVGRRESGVGKGRF